MRTVTDVTEVRKILWVNSSDFSFLFNCRSFKFSLKYALFYFTKGNGEITCLQQIDR